jgi:hypothetical protein
MEVEPNLLCIGESLAVYRRREGASNKNHIFNLMDCMFKIDQACCAHL